MTGIWSYLNEAAMNLVENLSLMSLIELNIKERPGLVKSESAKVKRAN